MGKITSRRRKYHEAAKKREEKEPAPSEVKQTGNASGLSTLPFPVPMFNPFAGLKIDPAALNIPPPEEWDRKTVVSIQKEITKGKNKKKKAKIRKELLLKKLQATRELQIVLENKKRREQTVITKDMQPLLDALPSVDLIHYEASERTKMNQLEGQKVPSTNASKDRNSMKASQKQKEILKDINIFEKFIGNEQYKANPAETVLTHLKAFVNEQRWNTARNGTS